MTMTLYHVNTETGNVGQCSAQKRDCPYGDSAPHFSSASTAHDHYEDLQSSTEFLKSNTKRVKPVDFKLPGEKNLEDVNNEIIRILYNDESLRYGAIVEEQKIQQAISQHRGLSEDEFSAREEYVENVTSKLKDLGYETEEQFSRSLKSGVRVYNADRSIIHDQLINELMDKFKYVPMEKKGLIAGGLGGAGKGSILRSMNVGSNYATINPDDVKEIMASKGLIPKIPGLSPMEASTLIHEEASHVSKLLAEKLMAKGTNINYDITMAGLASTKNKIDRLKEYDYVVNAVFVDITTEMSEIRAKSRYSIGLDEYIRSGGRDIGGRPVPKGVNHGSKCGRQSQNADNLVELYKTGAFQKAPIVYNNMGSAPKKISFGIFALADDF